MVVNKKFQGVFCCPSKLRKFPSTNCHRIMRRVSFLCLGSLWTRTPTQRMSRVFFFGVSSRKSRKSTIICQAEVSSPQNEGPKIDGFHQVTGRRPTFCFFRSKRIMPKIVSSWNCKSEDRISSRRSSRPEVSFSLPGCMVYLPILYVYHKNQANVSKYTIHGWYGFDKVTRESILFLLQLGPASPVFWISGCQKIHPWFFGENLLVAMFISWRGL